MGYAPTRLAPERIMVMGDAGVGKSHLYLSIAKRLPDAMVRVVECDWTSSLDRLKDQDGYRDLQNLEVEHCYPDEWEEQLRLAQWLRDQTKPGDWAGFDSITHTWSACSEWFVERVIGGDVDEWFTEQRIKHQGKSGDIAGWDWGYIKKEHNKLYKAIARVSGHLLITAELAALGDNEKKDDRQLFGRLGFRPAGRKQMAHIPATVAFLKRTTDGSRYMQTYKDRGREASIDAEFPMGDFFRDYLVKVAGWKLESSATTSTPQTPESSQ